MKKSIILLGLIAFFNSINAQSNIMDLEKCLHYGMEHSPYMTLSKNELKMFEYNKRELYQPYLPTLNGQAGFDYNAKLPVVVIPAGGFAPVEIRMKMGQTYANTAAVQLDQKIYDQTAIIGMNGMKDYRALSELTSEKIMETMIYNIATAYYQVMIVDKQTQLLKDNEKMYSDLLNIVELQLEKGVVKQVDYNRIKVVLNNIKSQLSLVETARTTAINYLKTTIGMSLDDDLEINEDESILEGISLPGDKSVQIENLIDYRLNEQTLKLNELNKRVLKYAFLPQLSVYAQYGANSYSDDFRESFKKFNDFGTIGVKLTVPIFNGLKVNTAYNKQKIQVENLKAQNKLQEEGFKVQQLNARNKMLEAYSSYRTNQENIDLAKEVYDITSLSYQKGAASLSDFLNADYSYKEAQNNYMTSMINLLSSRLEYEKTKGNLSNYLNINK